MKNIFFKTIALLCCLYLVSCGEIDSSNNPSYVNLVFYNSTGNKIILRENDKEQKVLHDYLKDVRFKAIPANEEMGEINTNCKISDGGGYATGTPLPLSENFEYNYDEYPYARPNPEEFRLQIIHKNSIIFDEELLLHYKQGMPFEYVVKRLVKNTNGEWEPYISKKIVILNENGESTGYSFSVEL